jgi:HEAT repeat protein
MLDKETLTGLALGSLLILTGVVGVWLGGRAEDMVPISFMGIGVLVASIVVAGEVRRSLMGRREREVDRLFTAAGRGLGLTLGPAARPMGRSIYGPVDGTYVTATCVPTGPDANNWVTGVTVGTHHPLLARLQVRSRWKAAVTAQASASAHGAVEIGDQRFDRLVEVRGPAATAFAVLTHAARQAIAHLAHRGVVSVVDGQLTFETNERLWKAAELVTQIREAIAAVHSLPSVADATEALAAAATTDPDPDVRVQALRTLVAEQGDQASATETLERALADNNDAVRVVAAGALGERGVPVLVEIAERENGDDEAAARAINVLGRRIPTERLIAVLDAALHAERLPVALAAIDMLGRPRDPHACERLRELLRHGDEPERVAAANALARVSLPEAEDALDRALEEPRKSVRRAAARALGDAGGPASLVALRALLERDAADEEIGSIAKRAIAKIRQRLPDLGSGHVMLAESDSGQLSVADMRERGDLASAEE